MSRTITSSEFMPMLETVRGDLTDSTVGFVKFLPLQKPTDMVLAGSGTLVSAGGVRAILTAEHVISNLPNSGPIGLIVPTRQGPMRHRTIIYMEHVRKIPIAKGRDDSKGPDIGLLIPALTYWDLLPSGKIFYNLSKRRERMLNDPPPTDKGAWALCGMVAEWTGELPKEKGYEHGKSFNGMCGPVVLANQRQEGGFDYFSVQVAYNESYEGPESFGGCSGGGLWHLLIKERSDGSLEIFDSLLAGVAFYQSAKENDRKTIECHGRRSIYETVVNEFEKRVD